MRFVDFIILAVLAAILGFFLTLSSHDKDQTARVAQECNERGGVLVKGFVNDSRLCVRELQ